MDKSRQIVHNGGAIKPQSQMYSSNITNPLVKSPLRTSLIREMYYARLGINVLPGLIPVPKREIREVTKAVAITNDDNRIIDEEIDGVKSELSFDSVGSQGESESEILLTRKEKAQIARDVDALRWSLGKNRNTWLVAV